MRIEAEPAFVLHSRPYRETSVIVELFTREYGRLGAIARGVRSERPRFPRGALHPFQCLSLRLQGQGELPLLTDVDVQGQPPLLRGEALAAGLYVNELLMRLTERHDPHPPVFVRYAALLSELSAGPDRPGLAWALRRFERDLLAAMGYGLELGLEPDSGLPLDPAAEYLYDPEHGPRRLPSGSGRDGCPGAALLDLRADRAPAAAQLAVLRRVMRSVIRHHLGGRDLDAWRVLRGPVGSSIRSIDADR